MDLGRQFQLSGEKIKEIELCGESNPTEALMEYLHAKQPGLTVRTFYAKVEEIKRRDVLKKLKPVYDGRFVCIHIFELNNFRVIHWNNIDPQKINSLILTISY